MFTELEFLEAMNKFSSIVEEPCEYRLHYNENGGIYLCTQQHHPDNTQYLVVDATTYAEYYKYQVVNKKLKIIDTAPGYSVQLKKSTQGYAVVKNHAGIILESGETYDKEYYASNN